MRLLDTTTLELMSFQGWNVPGYAILSHVWETEEATFQDISNFNNIKDMHGYAKIVGACDTARRNGIGYIWIDTCCINKESSAELSEAINSMYKWYSGAQVCYAYLSDVPSTGDHGDRSLFAMSHWFTRGWTLQELIAPRKVVFYARDWVDIGTKTTLQDTISSVTGINPEIIVGRTLLESVPIAVRMSWAAGRNTTREEDIAYSLMGLFDVNMPLLYGEGRKAFIRLQLEIIKKNSDHSIFAWKEDLLSSMSGGLHGLLARSPAKFRGLGNVERILDPASGDEQPGHVSIGETLPYNITNRGLFIKLPTTEISEARDKGNWL
ncbi:heterokaryon incompatibility protein-domain-containing protein [Collybia nuda]|uniref:Heterokaryon incompatibility protein-domain-containing protein n=1 Tax=Collybia nuda TaxID=64659 RepID=A0A9P6CBQ8_9AGAR|nr:heterokaryon incompatibility protein-domain-containing protein [Collybia nuda]